jgi:flavin-dependent dehydrogenase
VDCPEDTIILDYHPALVPAYAWVFPMGHGRANVGVWFLAGRRAGQGNALHEWLTHSPTARKMLGRACQLSPIRGAPLAVGSWTGRWGVERMLLVGDALGGANPLSGEGLYEALLTARIASDVLCDRLRSGDLSREALTGYQAAVRQAVALPHRLSRWLSVLLRLPGCLNRVVAGARRQGRVAVAVLRAALPQPLSGRIMEAGENWEGRA